jgi:hypothetical protein
VPGAAEPAHPLQLSRPGVLSPALKAAPAGDAAELLLVAALHNQVTEGLPTTPKGRQLGESVCGSDSEYGRQDRLERRVRSQADYAAVGDDCRGPGLGLALIAEARRQIGEVFHSTPQAWLDAVEALSLAAIGKATEADRALLRAGKAIERGSESAPAPWPWVFSFDQPKLSGYRALVAVRLNRPAEALAAFADSLSAAQPAPKQRATIMLEVATAARQDGMQQRDNERIDESFRLASEALGIGITYSSERVIEKARRFRRNYAGPSTSHVRNFDERLRSTLL